MPKVTSKGQITIEKEVREFLGIVPGESHAKFKIDEGKVILINEDQKNAFEKYKGLCKLKLSTREVLELSRGDCE